jgi:hypothetical protein
MSEESRACRHKITYHVGTICVNLQTMKELDGEFDELMGCAKKVHAIKVCGS